METRQEAFEGFVGIFWVYRGEILSHRVDPTDEKDPNRDLTLDFIGDHLGHEQQWSEWRKVRSVARRYPYEVVPRGRVVLKRKTASCPAGGFRIFAPPCLKPFMNRILEEFRITSPAETEWFFNDEHYCVGIKAGLANEPGKNKKS